MPLLRGEPGNQLRPDTQAVLLLCGRLGLPKDSELAPLGPSGYEDLADWLRSRGMRPANLLSLDGMARLEEAGNDLPVPAARLRALLARGAALALSVESWTSRGVWVISRSDPAYPARLRPRGAGPPILFGAGPPDLLSSGGLAIVGSRDARENDLRYAREVAVACAQQGIQVVSGGARGIDTEAMLSALDAGGAVVGVLSDSLARVAMSSKYREALVAGSLVLVSPYDPSAGFDTGAAMGRNRYIYRLANWALVVCSTLDSGGTWQGATEALKSQATRVLVRSGEQSPEGNRKLLGLGATPFPSAPWTHLAGQLAALAEQGEDASGDAGEQAPADYAAALPLMLAHLQQPMSGKMLAEQLGVSTRLVQKWLNRAVNDHRIVKQLRPVRYVIAPPGLDLQVGEEPD